MTSKDNDEERVVHQKSDNIEFVNNDKAEKVIKELFESLHNSYQIGLETSMRDSDFTFDCVYLLYYDRHKINFKRGGSNIGSPDWIKNKKAAMNPISKTDNKCV